MLAWSTRLLAFAGASLLILLTVYLSRPSNPPMPWPVADIIFGLLAGVALGSLVLRETARIHTRLDESERRDGMLYALGGRVEHRMRHFADGPTLALARQQHRVVATVSPPPEAFLSPGLDPEVVDLARRLNAQMASHAEDD